VTDLVARRARSSPSVREALAGVLAETVEPRRVFSLSGIARSWLR
jgi:hypothetical protein